jgi:hypothetical protein
MLAEIVHDTHSRFADRARFSFALAAKTDTRFRCRSRSTTRRSGSRRWRWRRPRLGRAEQLAALQRLYGQSRRLERCAGGRPWA